jgi:hypothetical protein
MWWIAVAVVAAGAALWGPIVSNVEQAGYKVIETHGAIEIRDYAPMIVAQTEVSGARDEAISKGFRIIADYIFGNNTAQQKVAMTAPVIQQPSEKIAMTAPVIQQGEGDQWQVRFVMPSEYRMDTLPTPKNNAVDIKEIPGKRFVVIRFSGMADEEMLAEQTTTLNAFLKEKGLEPLSPPAYAFFNPPWTLPPLRRNEVMVEVAGR